MTIIIETENLKPIELFHTPQDWAYIEAWIERHPPADRAHLWTAAGMTWNLATTLAKTQLKLSPDMLGAIIALLHYQFAELNSHEELTATEQAILTPEQFQEIKTLIKETK